MSDQMQEGVDVEEAMLAGVNPETVVISSLIREPSLLREVGLELSPEDFLDLRLGEIMRGLRRMVVDREPIELGTVGLKLREWNIRGLDVGDLYRWDLDLATSANAAWYARIIRRDAVRRGLREVAVRLNQRAAGDPAVALAGAMEALKAIRDGSHDETFVAHTLGQVLEGPDDYDWVIPGLLERRERLMLTGNEGGGKSMFIRQVVILAAAGLHPFMFKPIAPVKVLVVDVENSQKQWRRQARPLVSRAALHGSRNPGDVIALKCVEKRFDITNDRDLGNVHKLIDEHQPDVLAIGPLYKLVPSINDDKETAPVLSALDSLRDRGCALLIEAHAGHSVDRTRMRDLRPRGSSMLLGWPEFGMGIRPGSGGEFDITRWRGDRDRRNWPVRVRKGHPHEWPWMPTKFTHSLAEES